MLGLGDCLIVWDKNIKLMCNNVFLFWAAVYKIMHNSSCC